MKEFVLPTGVLWDDPRAVSSVSAGSHYRAAFRCTLGHTWDALVKKVAVGQGCPFCSGRRVLVGFNDLGTVNPQAASLWNPEKNKLSALEVTAGSNKKVWWQCPKGHEWEALVSSVSLLGTRCPYCSGRRPISSLNDLATSNPALSSEWHPDKNGELLPSTVLPFSNKKVWWLCDKGHSWEAQVAERSRGHGKATGCPYCGRAKKNSRGETEVSAYIESLGFTVYQNHRGVVPGFEFDSFVPERGFAVEFNGIYWHQESKSPQYKHQTKWLAAKEAGVRLITVWEDDWEAKPSVVKSMLRHKLGVAEKSVGARKTRVVSVPQSEAARFLDANHIQGSASASFSLGLEYAGDLVALMSMKLRKGGEYELVRYATSLTVSGGHSKLLKACLSLHPEVTRIVTFADHEVSDGALYEKSGWVADKELRPDYKYVYRGQRVHKFNFRLKRFREDPELKFEEGLTETELAALNKIPRVWDSGKTRYVWDVLR